MCFKKVNYLPNISINTWLQTKYSFLRALSSMAIYLIHIKLQLLLLEGLEYFPPFFFSSFQTKLQSQRKYEQARGYFFCDVDILHSAALGGLIRKPPLYEKLHPTHPPALWGARVVPSFCCLLMQEGYNGTASEVTGSIWPLPTSPSLSGASHRLTHGQEQCMSEC